VDLLRLNIQTGASPPETWAYYENNTGKGHATTAKISHGTFYVLPKLN